MKPITSAQAAALARRHWHVTGETSALPSYLDQNFRIRSGQGDYVLKIAHPSWAREDLDLENCAMMALAAREPTLHWPQVQRTPAGEHLLTVPMDGGERHVRLLSFVPGTPWAHAIEALSPAQRRSLHGSLGDAVARLTTGMENLRHPAATRTHAWNLMALPALSGEIAHVPEAALRARVQTIVADFCARLPTLQADLPMAVIHNDANDLNVLVAQAGDTWKVTSVIDFGDTCTTFREANLAIACVYAMQHESDPVACARRVIAAYAARCPLRRAELEALPLLIAARLCQSILMATRARREQPDNTFTAVSQQGVRALLTELVAVAPDAIVRPLLETFHE
ncbi:MAG TPA: phosphotransferase [Rhodanobacteraceae bacterium]